MPAHIGQLALYNYRDAVSRDLGRYHTWKSAIFVSVIRNSDCVISFRKKEKKVTNHHTYAAVQTYP